MSYEIKIGLRYIFGRRKEKFISLISCISIIGVATGVCALIIVIGVMSGFDTELRDKIIGTSSHIVVDRLGGLDDPAVAMQTISDVDGVIACAPFINTQALLADHDRLSSVVVRGIDPKLEAEVTSVRDFIKSGSLDLEGGNKIIIGSGLAEQLALRVGNQISLISAAKQKKKTLGKMRENNYTISAIFTSGMYDYDTGVVFISLDDAKIFFENPILVSGISVKINDIYAADQIKKKIQEQLGFPYFTRTWMDMNRNLFNALKLEKTAMFIILTLIVLVAALNIASTLIMMVMEKTKDIGILKTIGATNQSIRAIFTMVGLFIGIIGTMLGTAAGLFCAYLLKTYEFIKLPEDVYYISKLPVRIESTEVIWIVMAAILISFCATFYPAYQASKLDPVEALRYE
ncbi:MAG: lipoprotein-releasing ABC transporter permease subunit [Candidatus Omnitrophica bacterium]|nr:lipoprotein-releasing ABC transporter permease subunit [Candidatus Omnitrophota bacterium]